MPSVKRLHQVFMKQELQEGNGGDGAFAVSDVLDAANANFLVIDPQFTVDKENFDRSNVNRPSVSPLAPLAGLTTGSCSFGLELTTAAGVAKPAWTVALEACGMRWSRMYAAEVSSVSPASGSQIIAAGERMVGGSSGGVAYMVHNLREGTTPDGHAFMRVIDAGTGLTAETWTSSDSGGSFVAGTAPSDVGDVWTPATFGLQTSTCGAVDANVLVGEIVTGQTSGAVGVIAEQTDSSGTSITIRRLNGYFTDDEDVSFSGSASDVTLSGGWAQSDVQSVSFGLIEDGRYKLGKGFRGSWSFSGELGSAGRLDFTMSGLVAGSGDAGPISGVTYTAQVPPVMLGVGFSIARETETTENVGSPRLQSVNFDHGSEVNIPRDATESAGVYDCAYITGRNSTGSMNLAVTPESVYDEILAMRNGDALGVLLTLQSPLSANKKFRIEAPAALMTAESPGEQNGFATTDYSLQLGSRGATGLDIADGELTISYQHSALPSS